MKKQTFRKIDTLFLSIILLIAVSLRLYKINIPLADFHSWRQADTAAVARNFVHQGFDLLHPRYDDLSNIQSGLENPQGYRMVEFPIYNAIFAFLYKYFPITSLEIYGRLTTIISSLIIISLIYYLVLKEYNRTAAVFAAFTYGVMPFFVFFSRVILPESTALAFSFISIFLIYLYLQRKKSPIINSLLFSGGLISFALSLLTKPTVIFYFPVFIYLFLKKYKSSLLKSISFYIFVVFSLLPLLLWRIYIQQFPQGIPANQWLITAVNTPQGLQKIFLKPAFFRWVFFERIDQVILGGYLTFFLTLGIVQRYKNFFFPSFLISSLLYLFVFQGGNVQHAYYQTIILPPIAIFIGLGGGFLFKNKRLFLHQIFLFTLVIITFGFSFFFSYYQVKDYYKFSRDLVNIAKIIQSLTKPEDKIITDTTGDTTLLYLSQRKGAPAPYTSFNRLKKLGYRYYVAFNQDQIEQLKEEKKFILVFENNKFALFKL